MATRTSSSSLRRRLAWTLGAATMIGLISLVLILVFHSSPRNVAVVKLDVAGTVAEETSAAANLTNTSNDGRRPTELHFQPATHEADRQPVRSTIRPTHRRAIHQARKTGWRFSLSALRIQSEPKRHAVDTVGKPPGGRA